MKESDSPVYKLWKEQEEIAKKQGLAAALLPKDFRCYQCRKSILIDKSVQSQLSKKELVTGCPFCGKSFL